MSAEQQPTPAPINPSLEWTEGFKAGYAAAYAEGYREGMAAGRADLYAASYADRKRAKHDAKARRYQEKEERRAQFLAAGSAQQESRPEPPRKKGRTAIEATITGKEQISPDMVRLFATAPGIIGRDLDKTDHYIKILFVPEGADYSWPFDLGHIKDTQPKHLRPVTRTYTLRTVDTMTGEMSIDFVLHGDTGLAGPWARDVQVGETFAFAGPGGGWAPTADYDHFVLAGDEAAAPAVAAALEKIPAGSTAVAFIEVEAPGHEIPMPENPESEVRFVYRNGEMPGTALSDAVRTYQIPDGNIGWFVHGVAEMIKSLRRYLFVNRGVSKRDASISGYWRLRMTEDEWQASKSDFVAELEVEEEAATREL